MLGLFCRSAASLAQLSIFSASYFNYYVVAFQNTFLGSGHLSSGRYYTLNDNTWRVSVSKEYQVVGPFPQEAREQHFISPSYPIGAAITFPLNFSTSYPSHLANEGYARWRNMSLSESEQHTLSSISHKSEYNSDSSTHYSISFPNVRWDTIRATEGWAGLQHHALLVTRVSLIPPRSFHNSSCAKPAYLLLSAVQCSQIAIYDSTFPSAVPRWYTGNIYAYANAPAIRIPLKYYDPARNKDAENLSTTLPDQIMLSAGRSTELDVLIGLDYEIRLFGDPLVSTNSTMPIIQAELRAEIECENSSHALDTIGSLKSAIEYNGMAPEGVLLKPNFEESMVCALVGGSATHVIPDFVNGQAIGDTLGIEITSCSHHPWTIVRVAVEIPDGDTPDAISLELYETIRFAPSQTRLVSLRMCQTAPMPFTTTLLKVTFHLQLFSPKGRHQPEKTFQTTIDIFHHITLPNSTNSTRGIQLTYASVSNTAASAVLLPPLDAARFEATLETRILLALHGAGVMHTSPIWLSALPRPPNAWVLVVQGLTTWGLDWREASRADVCSALRALVLRLTRTWNEEDYCTTHDLLDSMVERQSPGTRSIPVVAIGHSNGGQGSLQLASLFPDNIPASIPAAGYTSARLYVSRQHSRGSLFTDATLEGIMKASVQSQDGDLVAGNLALSRVRLVHGRDDENVPAWHSRERMALVKTWSQDADISLNEVPGKPHFWSSVFQDEPVASAIRDLIASPYTKLRARETPFTLTVVWPSESGSMMGWRVRELTTPGRLARIRVNGSSIHTTNVHGISINPIKARLERQSWIIVDQQRVELPPAPLVWLRRDENLRWKVVKPFVPYASGPISSSLNSAKMIKIVIPSPPHELYKSIALRIAHNLFTYLKLDCDIVEDQEALFERPVGGSVIVIGGYDNKYGSSLRSSPLGVLPDRSISISGLHYNQPGTAALSLHMNHLYVDAVDDSGYERALRAVPLRTGVPGPEWMILGEEFDRKGYGGVLAAGFWDRTGELSEVMSYFS